MNNNEEVFTSYANMNCVEIKEMINGKMDLLQDKLNGKINEGERQNDGYLLWDSKMILRNIYMSCDKLTNKFADELTNDEILYFNNISGILKNDENNWVSIDSIKSTFDKIKNNKKLNKISMVSINGLKINDKATGNMKNLVMDSKIPYQFNRVFFSVDSNDIISRIVFYTTSSSNETYGIKEAQVEYNRNKLTTVEDFNKCLGIGKEEIDERNSLYKYIKYVEDNCELILTIREGSIINIEIRNNQ